MQRHARPTGCSISRAARDALLPHSNRALPRRPDLCAQGSLLARRKQPSRRANRKTVRIGITQALIDLYAFTNAQSSVSGPEAPSPPWLDSQGIVFRAK